MPMPTSRLRPRLRADGWADTGKEAAWEASQRQRQHPGEGGLHAGGLNLRGRSTL